MDLHKYVYEQFLHIYKLVDHIGLIEDIAEIVKHIITNKAIEKSADWKVRDRAADIIEWIHRVKMIAIHITRLEHKNVFNNHLSHPINWVDGDSHYGTIYNNSDIISISMYEGHHMIIDLYQMSINLAQIGAQIIINDRIDYYDVWLCI